MVNILVDCRQSKRLIKQQDRQGNTALHIAIDLMKPNVNEEKICSIVRSLFNKGANRVAKNSEGKTPLSMADQYPSIKQIINQRQWMGRLLVPGLSKGEPPGKEGREACIKTDITITNISIFRDKVAIEPEEIVNVQELLYSDTKLSEVTETPQGPITCQWFHIPTNNMAWVNVRSLRETRISDLALALQRECKPIAQSPVDIASMCKTERESGYGS
ncbi:hypothetical protein K449DRAFT_429067 [Hypoxylon sp. EC38]|nr:hypothetical protein K449DRAFT_429067 [Hypoxylon sp. EC38]